MNMRILLPVMIAGFLSLPGIASAQNVTLTQIDPAELLVTSRIDCYLSITDDEGEPLENADPDSIRMEHETGEGMKPAKILDIQRSTSPNGKTTFLFVLDNSGSMYEPAGDGSTGNRMDHAVRAVREFLRSMDSSRDSAGLAVFNTRYSLLAEPGSDISEIEAAIEGVEKPDDEEAYTELYYAVNRAAMDMTRYRGRKAIVLLSDGENYPYFARSGNPHPVFGKTLFHPEDGLALLKREGITLYGVNFAPEKDPELSSISIDSGGTMYDAVTDKELLHVYERIRDRIVMEYKVSLAAPLVFLETPRVRAEYEGAGDTRTYYTRPLLGGPGEKSVLLLLSVLLAAFLAWALLLFIRFEKPADRAEISMLRLGPGKSPQRTIALTSQKTVIGGSKGADLTVAGIPTIRDYHATIIRNEKTGKFTVNSDEEIRVNNRMTRKRNLEPGDVINIEGAAIVFDEP